MIRSRTVRFFYEKARAVHSLNNVHRRVSVAFVTEPDASGNEIVRFGAAIWRPSPKVSSPALTFSSREERRQAFLAGKIPKTQRDVWTRKQGKEHALERLSTSPVEFSLTGDVRLSDVIKAIHEKLAEKHPHLFEKVKAPTPSA